MCLFFFWLQTIPARSTIPLYGRLIEAYIVKAWAGVLRFERVEPTQSACNSSAIAGATRAAERARGQRLLQIVAIKGLCRVAAQRYACVAAAAWAEHLNLLSTTCDCRPRLKRGSEYITQQWRSCPPSAA